MTTIESGASLELTTPIDASTPVITEGCYAVVRKVGGEHQRVVRLTANSNVLVEKLRFEAESAFGHPFGLFEVIGKRLVPATVEDLRKRDGGDLEMAMAGVDADNIGLNGNEKGEVIAPSAVDAETRQVLTEEAISEMKQGGLRANDLVSKLVSGSASFASRTTYAKSKYIRRKTKKHQDRVLILKPTIRLLCEAYLRKDYDRAGSLRLDQLALMLHQGAVHTGRRVLVFDQVLGLVTAAVTERLAGAGACVHLHRGTIAQSIPCFSSMEFSDQVLSAFYPVRIDCVLGGFKQPEGEGDGGGAAAAEKEEVKMMETDEVENDPEETAAAGEKSLQQLQPSQPGGRPYTQQDVEWQAIAAQKRVERLQREADGLAAINEGLDTILIGTRSVDPVSLLELLYDKLRPSGNVVVYSPTVQHVMRAQQWLREHGAVHVVLSDQMYRVQQVLPNRTHPLMSQMVVGGYVLAAIKVLPGPEKKD